MLRKQPAGRDVNDTDVFFFNADFTDPAFRVHINSIQVKETVRAWLGIYVLLSFTGVSNSRRKRNERSP